MTTDRPDPYAVLGLRRGASPAEVTHAYRELLRRHHPDTRDGEHDGDPESDARLGQIIAAYAQLRHGVARPPEQPVPPPPTSAARRSARDDSTIRAGPVRWLRR